jgi:hypothetical protein
MNTVYLNGWDVKAEQRKADFMEHMYKCSGRKDQGPGIEGLYTGLWENFCLKEAGPFCRNMYFDRLQAAKEYEKLMEKEIKETVVPD